MNFRYNDNRLRLQRTLADLIQPRGAIERQRPDVQLHDEPLRKRRRQRQPAGNNNCYYSETCINLYNATTKFCGLSEQVVFHDRENKYNYVKTVQDK